jgi:hypothetical protein
LPRSTADRYIELAKRFSHVSNPAEITGLRQAYIQTGILPYPPRKKKKTRDQSGIALLERVKSIRSYCGHLNVTKLDGSIPNQLVSEITGLVGDLRKSTVIDVEVQIIPTDETQKVEPKLLDAPKVTPADPAPADAAARDPQPLGDAAAPPLPPSPPQGQSDQLQDTAAAAGNKFADKTPAGAAEPDLQRQGGAGVPPTPPSASLAQAARPEDAATAASTRDKPAVPPPADAAAHGPQPQGASGTPSTPPSLPQPHPAGTEGQAPAVLDKHEREVQPAPAAGAETADQPATDDGGPTASAASNPATPVQPSQTEAPLGKTNDEAPAGSEQVVFLLADGSVHQVPWIHNRMLTFEAIDQHVQSMKSHYENPKTPDPYDQPTLVKFQKALIAAASLAVSVLGEDPTATDLEIAFNSLNDIRGMLPDPIR